MRKTDLGRLEIGDSFQVQKGGRAYTIHDKVYSNPSFDYERELAFGKGVGGYTNRYIICMGPKGLCVYEEEKQVIVLNKIRKSNLEENE